MYPRYGGRYASKYANARVKKVLIITTIMITNMMGYITIVKYVRP